MENLLRLSAILRARAFWYDLILLHSSTLQRKTRLQNINKLTVKLILNQNYPEPTK